MRTKYPIVDGKRVCTRCLETKPIDEFYRQVPQRVAVRPRRTTGNSLYMAECKTCFCARMRRALDEEAERLGKVRRRYHPRVDETSGSAAEVSELARSIADATEPR